MRDSAATTNFYLAIKANNVEEVGKLIRSGRVEIDHQFFPHELTPLQIAIAEGHWEIFQLLISYGCSVNKADNRGCTPLLSACRLAVRNRDKFVEKLISERANVNCSDTENRLTPLHWAVIGRNERLLQFLLDSGADPSRPNRSYRTPLHMAVQSQWYRGAEILIKAGSDSNFRDRDGFSPFYYVCICLNDLDSRHRLLALMLACGADMSLDMEYWATAKNQDLITGVDRKTLEWMDEQRSQMPLSLKWLCRIKLRQDFGVSPDEKCLRLANKHLPKGMRDFLLLDSL